MTFDPDLVPLITTIPFITYGFQDMALDTILYAILDKYDIVTEKSRRMGLTWLILAVYVWLFLFRPFLTFRVLSIKEELVDKTDSTDCLFWKILFLIDQMPWFLRPEYNHNHLSIINYDNNSSIVGLATTSDSARGGRCTSMFPDEFATVPDGDGLEAATQSVTKSRIFNSTHKGAGTTFYRLSIKDTIKKLTLHWSLNETFNQGLYYSDKNGELILYDKFTGIVTVSRIDYNFPENYPFVMDGKLRSPWYDNECERATHPMHIAQELDMDPFASDFLFFDGPMIAEIEKTDVRPPFLEGDLEYDEDTLDPIGFIEGKNGPLKLWFNLDPYGKVPEDIIGVAGADISAGTGASNSAYTFASLATGEKLVEYANPWIKPVAFAKYCTALSRWLNSPHFLFDGAGPGRSFGDSIIKMYRNLYYRRNEKGYKKKVSDIPGVFLNPDEKRAVFTQYLRALTEKRFIQRSSVANQECLLYVYKGDRTVEHSGALTSQDPSGAGANHGDRAVADALAAKGLYLLGNNKLISTANTAKPVNCVASRREQYENKLKKESEW